MLFLRICCTVSGYVQLWRIRNKPRVAHLEEGPDYGSICSQIVWFDGLTHNAAQCIVQRCQKYTIPCFVLTGLLQKQLDLEDRYGEVPEFGAVLYTG